MEENIVRRQGAVRMTGTIALAGAVLQVVYGLLACVWRYPRITGQPFEAIWGLATLGMIANVLTWLAIGVARPRRLAAAGGVLAIAGFAARFVISVVIVADPHIDTGTASVAVAIPVTIVLMFSGLALLGAATRRARRRPRAHLDGRLARLLDAAGRQADICQRRQVRNHARSTARFMASLPNWPHHDQTAQSAGKVAGRRRRGAMRRPGSPGPVPATPPALSGIAARGVPVLSPRPRPSQPRVRNRTWPGWILAVLPSRVARAVATTEGKPRLCGKVLVDTRISPA